MKPTLIIKTSISRYVPPNLDIMRSLKTLLEITRSIEFDIVFSDIDFQITYQGSIHQLKKGKCEGKVVQLCSYVDHYLPRPEMLKILQLNSNKSETLEIFSICLSQIWAHSCYIE